MNTNNGQLPNKQTPGQTPAQNNRLAPGRDGKENEENTRKSPGAGIRENVQYNPDPEEIDANDPESTTWDSPQPEEDTDNVF